MMYKENIGGGAPYPDGDRLWEDARRIERENETALIRCTRDEQAGAPAHKMLPKVRIVSYGQCGEDVVLDRIFRGKKDGFYVDVGAGHPVLGSITKNLADAGWRGVDIEPSASLASLLKTHRPNSTVIAGAVTGFRGVTTFLPDADWARSRTGQGGGSVPCDTLTGYLEGLTQPGFEVLKIDIEGAELDAFPGMQLGYWRPQVILAETHNCRELEAMVESVGYTPCLFDGINRFFVRNDLPHLFPLAQHGPTPADLSIPAIWFDLLRADARDAMLPARQEQPKGGAGEIHLVPVEVEHIALLRGWYFDPIVQRNLYGAPYDATEFARYMLRPHRFIAYCGEAPVGTCHIEQHDHVGVIGIVVDKRFRGMGIGEKIIAATERVAQERGIRVLSADIYSDNMSAIKMFQVCGYREFIWMEKNITE